jgi:hypothetical protein
LDQSAFLIFNLVVGVVVVYGFSVVVPSSIIKDFNYASDFYTHQFSYTHFNYAWVKYTRIYIYISCAYLYIKKYALDNFI